MALTRPRYSQIYDTDYKQSVRAATTADVGNLLATGNMTNSVDGVTLNNNDRVLVKNQSNAEQNGIYRVVTVGTGSNGTWERSKDANANDRITSGMTTIVSEGDSNANKTFRLTTPDPIVVGVTELTFADPFVITASAGGANTYVQFNDISQLGGVAGFTFNKTSNLLTVSGNIVSDSYFIGNGSQLTGIDATSIQSGTSNVKVFNSGNVSVSVGGAANVISIGQTNTTITGNLLPSANVTYDLGSPTQRWRTGYFAAETLDLGGSTISVGASGFTFTPAGGSATTIAGNGTVTGTLLTASQPNITSVGNLTQLSVTGNVTASYFFGNGSQLTGIDATSIQNGTSNVRVFNNNNITISAAGVANAAVFSSEGLTLAGNLTVNGTTTTINSTTLTVDDLNIVLASGAANPTAANGAGITVDGAAATITYASSTDTWNFNKGIVGTLNTGSQPNINSIGTLSTLSVSGNIGAGNVNATNVSGTILTANQPNITDVGALNSLEVTGNVNTVNVTASYGFFGTIRTAAQPSITSLGTLSGLSIDGNITFTGTGRRFIADMSAATQSDRFAFQTSTLNNNTNILGIPNGTSVQTTWQAFGNSDPNNAHRIFFGTVNSTDTRIVSDATGTANVRPMVFIVGSKESLRIGTVGNVIVPGNITVNSDNNTVAIINGGTAGVGNIGASGAGFNTVFAKATQAQYADLAEIYTSDRNYIPGTVVVFGGDQEVTVSLTSHDPSVAGVISTNPAYIMNSDCDGVFVALQGRVPCRVLGPVSKGDRVVTSDIRGVAERLDMSKYQPGCIIGKALEDIVDDSIQTIEVVVGRV